MQRCMTLFALLALLPVAFAAKIDAVGTLTDGAGFTVKPADFHLKVTKNGNLITDTCYEVPQPCGGKVTCKKVDAGLCDAISTEGITVVNAGKSESLDITWNNGSFVDVVEGKEIMITPVNAKVKLCFAKESTLDRPWRKFKADVGSNKQCIPKAIDTVKWTEGKKKWTVKSMVPRCKAYLRVFAMNADGKHAYYSDSDIFQINGYDGLEPSITIGAVIMSIISLGTLVAYFGYTIMKQD